MTIKQFYPTQSPVLNLNYISNQRIDPRITFTRASTATYVDRGGVIRTAAANEARIDHDPDTGESLGLLLEESRTNLFWYSAEFDNARWTKTATTVTANAETAPDGTITADRLQIQSGSGFTHDANVSVSGTHTISMWVKAVTPGTNDRFRLVISGTNLTSDLTATNEWVRHTYTATADTSNNAHGIARPVTGSSDVYVWGAQIEAGAFPTSTIPTSGATATRAAETATLSNAGIFDIQDYTILNSPFGCAGGGSPLSLVGPYVKNVTVYDQDLTASETAALNKVSDGYWRWRVKGSTFALPDFTTDGEVEVDWGDGTVETLTTSEHTFSDGGGFHEIGFKLVSGTYFYPKINDNATHDQKVEAVGPCPDAMSVNLQQAYSGCSNLKTFDPPLNISGTTLYYAFRNCTGLTSFPFVDTSNVTQLTSAWYNNTSMAAFPALDTSNVTTFNYAWFTNNSLTEFPLIDTSSATDFTGAWYNCTSLTSFPAIDTSSATTFSNTWRDCRALTSFPFVNSSNVTDMNNTWFNLQNITSFPEIDTSSVTTMSGTWYNNYALTSFPLLDTSLVTNFNSCWFDCNSLTSFPAIDTSSGTLFNGCWRRNQSLTSFPSIDTSNATDLGDCWRDCSGLTSFPSINTANVTNFERAWYGCSSLTSFPSIDTSSGTTLVSGWTNCSSLTSFPTISTASVTNFNYAWQNCSGLTSFPSIDTSAGTTFYQTWRGCSSLTSFPTIDTSAATDVSYAWFGCSGLTAFPSLNINASNTFSNSWIGCSGLTTFPANFFDSWSPASIENQCFNLTWDGCGSLDPAGVVNILDSIAASGVSAPSGTGANDRRIWIDWNGTGTPATTAATAISTLKSRNWEIYLNGALQ